MEVIEIKSRWTGAVLYSGEHANVKKAVEAAVKAGVYLADANLTGANLTGAYLADADLTDADLTGAYLAGADLAGADLARANLTGADLSSVSLGRANLGGAGLSSVNLSRANLTGADLARANLTGADLTDAHLSSVNLTGATLTGATLTGADLSGADLADATLADAKAGAGDDEAVLVGSRPIVKIGPIGSRNDWLLVFWCGDAGVRISTGCQQQITEAYFLERLAEAHGEGEQANIHAQHYLEALAFAKRLLIDQAGEKL